MNRPGIFARTAVTVLLILCTVLSGCHSGGGKQPAPSPETTDFRSDSGDESVSALLPDSASNADSGSTELPSEESKVMTDSAYLEYTKLGLYAFAAVSDRENVADALPSHSTVQKLTVRAFGDGTAHLTVSDYWGHSAIVRVTVEGGEIREMTVTEPFSDPAVVNVRLAGAVADGVTDDTAAVQAVIDSLKNGGEVLFPAGVYSLRRLVLGEGITLRLQGKVEDATAGYTSDLAARVERGNEFAVLRSQLMANNFILNHQPGTNDHRLSGALGKSNITISGGMIDLNGAIATGAQIDVDLIGPEARSACTNTCAIAVSYGENFLFENIIFKDGYAGHAMQLCGVRHVAVRNCMFAGCTIRTNVKGSAADSDLLITRETIQIEYAHTGAIPPSTFEPGEFYYCSDIAVTGCYFGKSDKAGYQMICIGQHGQNRTANCTGLTIEGNVFDNPYIHALSLLSYVDVTIRGNRFISDREGYDAGYLIALNTKKSNSTYAGTLTSGGNTTVVNGMKFEHDGLLNVSITGNSFLIGGTSNKRLLTAESTGYLPGAQTVDIIRRVEGSFLGDRYIGFLPCNNYIGGLTLSDNRITVSAANYRTDYLATFSQVVGLRIMSNTVSLSQGIAFSDNWSSIAGFRVSSAIPDGQAYGLKFVTDLTGYTILLPDGSGGTITVRSDGSPLTLLLSRSTPHLRFSYTIGEDRCVTVAVEADEGFSFRGWRLGNEKFTPAGASAVLSGDLTLYAICQ